MVGGESMNDTEEKAGPVLQIADLTVGYRQREEWLRAVRNVSLTIPAGETCGLVGESGSGKTTLGLAIMRYLPEEGLVCEGTIRFNGRNLLEMKTSEIRTLWGSEIALVPQDPLSSLNPSLKVGQQVDEILERHLGLSGRKARQRTLELFEMVQLGDPERVAERYPHQISGGMLQRVLIAMALSTEPQLLILDEPTTSLDVTTQANVLDLLRELIQGRQTAVLYISHNLGVVAQISDRVAVLYASELVEDAPTHALYRQPLHPYTQGLLDSVPKLGETKREVGLRPIEGRIPPLDDLPVGCIFRPRCPLAIEICEQHPPLYDAGERRRSRCHRFAEIKAGVVNAHRPPLEIKAQPLPEERAAPVLDMENVEVSFAENRSIFDVLLRREASKLRAVDGISLTILQGRTLGLVGESGSGKTTLARAIVGLVERNGGQMELLDVPLAPRLQGRDQDVKQKLQIVFQNPEEALNPYMSVRETLRRPIRHLLGRSQEEAGDRVVELLQDVHLSSDYAQRLPGQMSGGEKQRVAVARAFAPNPELLVADEPVTSLDVSVQASIINLLHELQAEHGISILFISHDLAVVGYLADYIAVIYLGQLMETGPTAAIFAPPYHPYTEALLSAVPLIDPEGQQEQIRLKGEIPSPSEALTGCPFHTRCHRFLGDICVEEVPPWRVEEETGDQIFCHIPLDELRVKQRRPFKFRENHESDEE
jgi:peptide/nickel transport system ATP-binding protein